MSWQLKTSQLNDQALDTTYKSGYYKPAMLMIRLARVGKTKKPYFRLIISEKTKDTHGDYLENLGQINPHTKPRLAVLKSDRIKYWLEKGAQLSPSVHNLLVDNGVISEEKLRVWKPKKRATAEAKVEAKAPAVGEAKPEEVKEAAKTESAPAETPAS